MAVKITPLVSQSMGGMAQAGVPGKPETVEDAQAWRVTRDGTLQLLPTPEDEWRGGTVLKEYAAGTWHSVEMV